MLSTCIPEISKPTDNKLQILILKITTYSSDFCVWPIFKYNRFVGTTQWRNFSYPFLLGSATKLTTKSNKISLSKCALNISFYFLFPMSQIFLIKIGVYFTVKSSFLLIISKFKLYSSKHQIKLWIKKDIAK